MRNIFRSISRSRKPCESTDSGVVAECDSTTSDITESLGNTSSTTMTSALNSNNSLDCMTANKDMLPEYSPNKSLSMTSLDFNTDSLEKGLPPNYSTLVSSTTDSANLGPPRNQVAHYAPAIMLNPLQVQAPADNMTDVPLRELLTDTLTELSSRFDMDGIGIKDWKYLAAEIGMANHEVMKIKQTQTYYTTAVLHRWNTMIPLPTIADLIVLLEKLERNDIITDMMCYFERDARRFRSENSKSFIHSSPSLTSQISNMSNLSNSSFEEIGTYSEKFSENPEQDDMASMIPAVGSQDSCDPPPKKQLILENYDALILFDNNDGEFVRKLINNLEKQGFKLCIPARDIPAGTTQYETNLQFMFERSRKIVIVMSNELFESRAYMWHMNQLIGRDPIARDRKIIPVKYKAVTVSNILDHLCACDLMRTLEESWFWDKLYSSIKL